MSFRSSLLRYSDIDDCYFAPGSSLQPEGQHITSCLYDIAALQVILAKCSLHIENLSMMELFLGRVRSLC